MSSQQLYYPTKINNIPKTPNFGELKSANTSNTVTPNPYSFEVPTVMPSYRHPNHTHGLYMVFGMPNRICDNHACRKNINTNDVRFCCPPCDFDLCTECFQYAMS